MVKNDPNTGNDFLKSLDKKLWTAADTTYRPFGTNVFTPGRYVGAEEVEDDGVLSVSKPKRGLNCELATQFHESEKLQPAIRDNFPPLLHLMKTHRFDELTARALA